MDMGEINDTRGHMHGMAMPPSRAAMNGTAHHRHMMMHMTFFWGRNAEVLFSGWPGYDHLGMYILSLVVVFVLAVLVEWLSNINLIKEIISANHVAVGLVQTAMYGVRIGIAYMLMLAVMSFNGGIFLVAVAGHALGFLFFGSRVFNPPPSTANGKTTDLPPMSCNC